MRSALALLCCLLLACGSEDNDSPPGFEGGAGEAQGGESGKGGSAGKSAAGSGGKTGDAGKGGSESGGAGSGGAGAGGSPAGAAGSAGQAAGAGQGGAGVGGAGSGGAAQGGAGQGGAAQGGAGGADAGSAGQAGSGAGGAQGGEGGAGSGGSAAGQAGAGAGGAGAGGAGQGGGAGSGGALVCDDKGVEPNDSAALAAPACQPAPCEITGSDKDGSVGYGGPHPVLKGTVGGADVDYFKFRGKDTTFTSTDPSIKTDSKDVKICVFTACDVETVNHKCNGAGVEFEKNENGVQGCCRTTPGEVKADHDCVGSPSDDDSATIFVRVTPAANVCASYEIDFHF